MNSSLVPAFAADVWLKSLGRLSPSFLMFSLGASAPEKFPVAEIDLLVGWRAGEDEYLFTKAVAMVREWLLDTEEKDRLHDVLKEILAEAEPPAGND